MDGGGGGGALDIIGGGAGGGALDIIGGGAGGAELVIGGGGAAEGMGGGGAAACLGGGGTAAGLGGAAAGTGGAEAAASPPEAEEAAADAPPFCMERWTIKGTWSSGRVGATYLMASFLRQWPSSSNMANRMANGIDAHALRFTCHHYITPRSDMQATCIEKVCHVRDKQPACNTRHELW